MEPKTVKIWYDAERDRLEVSFDPKAGDFRETASAHVIEKVDDEGNVLGFEILDVSLIRKAPIDVVL